ncbi:putative Rap/Ran GTPase-activating protein [Histomonas meleagridis]|uniref:putative Rap/Ran GTPase-activating protein n=1 Tax=Histomonas meleagridis TaxID=135588 RepID=UPI0035596000|nr:putative Rap/Ran GTPase-activating protein [Histomonas meleagridis]KAH0796472.1 putative Rap/Ran GTPase-activating protein [Histomonas meleagridis]
MEETSPSFQEFISTLGWTIDLATHHGYDAGLNMNNLESCKASVYYADLLNEVMFHIAPIMETDEKDVQQIKKKKHIGNDHIHIIWCENTKEYNHQIITSQFNNVHIIIYPLKTCLFRISVKKKDDAFWVGPLSDQMIVSKKVLPVLVRQTVICAMNAYYATKINDGTNKAIYMQSRFSKLVNKISGSYEYGSPVRKRSANENEGLQRSLMQYNSNLNSCDQKKSRTKKKE